MNFETLFAVTNLLVAPFWILMILAPTWAMTKKVIEIRWILLPIALTYALPILPRLATDLPKLANPHYATINALLATPAGTALAWAHILTADLFVGRWIYLDSRSRNINPFLMAPIMLLSLLAGPLGFTLYLALTIILRRSHRESSVVSV